MKSQLYLRWFSENFFICNGEINLLQEYPIVYFNCSITSEDKRQLLKRFSIKYKDKNKPLDLIVQGNINILNNKINFKRIIMNQDYVASIEDLKYFKQTFENILFSKDFLGILLQSLIYAILLNLRRAKAGSGAVRDSISDTRDWIIIK